MTALSAHGRHRRPSLHRRVLASLRAIRRRRAVEEARDDAYAADLHEFNADRYIPAPPPPPPVVAAGPPPAAVQPDRDVPGMEHLASGQYGDWGTGQFKAIARGWEG